MLQAYFLTIVKFFHFAIPSSMSASEKKPDLGRLFKIGVLSKIYASGTVIPYARIGDMDKD